MLYKERGVEIETTVLDPKHPMGLSLQERFAASEMAVTCCSTTDGWKSSTCPTARSGPARGRTQKAVSGYGEAHRETAPRRRASQVEEPMEMFEDLPLTRSGQAAFQSSFLPALPHQLQGGNVYTRRSERTRAKRPESRTRVRLARLVNCAAESPSGKARSTFAATIGRRQGHGDGRAVCVSSAPADNPELPQECRCPPARVPEAEGEATLWVMPF